MTALEHRHTEAEQTLSAAPPITERLSRGNALAQLLHPVRRHLAACALLSALASAAGFAPYIAVSEIARAALANDSASLSGTVWTWAVIGVVGACLRLALSFASSRIGHYADAETLHTLRIQIVQRLGVVPLGWFRGNGSGSVKKAMTDDLEDMHVLIAHAIGEIVGAAVAIVVGCAYLLTVDVRLALITVAVLAVAALSYRVAMRSMSVHLNRLIAAENQISSASVEYADGITVVKTYGSGKRLTQRFDAAVTEYGNAMRAWASETQYSSAITRVLGSEMAVLVIVMTAGLFFVHAGSMSMSEVLPFLVVGVGLPTSITPAVHGSQGLRKGRMSATNVAAVLTQAALPEPSSPAQPHGHRVEFHNVDFSYASGDQVLHRISAVCEPGTVTAIVGPSGAGKSTLAALIPRFYDVGAGAIKIGGVDIREMSGQTLLSSMSLVFQEVVLLNDTVAENIRIGRPQATDDEVREAATAANVHHVIAGLPDGYDTLLGSGGGGGLSGGEQQRLTIARAIVSHAPIVILDEATAALDPDSEMAVQQALATLAAGKTVIVIAHRLHTIATADQILVLENGHMVESGTKDQLLAGGGLFNRLWSAQQEVTAR